MITPVITDNNSCMYKFGISFNIANIPIPISIEAIKLSKSVIKNNLFRMTFTR